MLSKSTISFIRSLRQNKYRQKYHKIVVEGDKSIRDLLNESLADIHALYATQSWIDSAGALLDNAGITAIGIDVRELASISSFSTPQPVLAVCEMPSRSAEMNVVTTELCLYLDGIRDPGNAGTIFRIADWFGIRTVFQSPDTVDPWNPKVIQGSMGSIFRIQWAECSLKDILAIPDARVFTTVLDGASMYDHPLSPCGVVVLGNEGTGVRWTSDLQNVHRISIPGIHTLGADSLNVAVAAGVICAEFRRRFG